MRALGKHKLLASCSASAKLLNQSEQLPKVRPWCLRLRLCGAKLITIHCTLTLCTVNICYKSVQNTNVCTADLPAIFVQNKHPLPLAPNHVLETSRSKVNSPGASEVETVLQLHSVEVETAFQL